MMVFRNTATAILLVLACLAPVRTGHAAEPGDTIVYSHVANAGPLNPHLYSPNQMFAQEMVYEPLVRLGDDGLMHPCLAESWEVSADGLVYTFHLRRDAVFSDGQPFDAPAAARNFEHIMANKGRHAWLDLVNRIDRFEAVDRHTFRLTLNSPYHPTLRDLSLPRPFRFLSPLSFPDNGTTRDGIKAPVGTGAWKLAESRLGEYDLFVRNDLYWGDKPTPGRVLVKVIPDPMSRVMALQTGEIDLIYGQGQLAFDAFGALRDNPAYATAVSGPVGTLAVAVNSNRFPTDDPAVRQALQHLADKDSLIRGVFLGTQPRADTLFAPVAPDCDIGLVPYAFDPGLADRLLTEAGWVRGGNGPRIRDGQPLVIDFCFIGNDAAQKAVAEVLQGQFARAGVMVNLIGEEEDSFLRRQKDGSFGMILNPTWGPPFEPHAMLASMRLPSHADYQAQLGLPMKADIDRDITRALSETNDDARRELYRSILTTLHEQAVYLPICHVALLAAYKKDAIGGFRFAPGKSAVPFEDFRKQ